MFFITRLTENTNLAASIPASEQVFNAARVNIMLVRPRFAELDIASKPRPAVQQAFAHSAETERWDGGSGSGSGKGKEREDEGKD
jgi:Ras-related GTP-binding protein A/B